MFLKCLKENSSNYTMAAGQVFLLIGIVMSRYGLMGQRAKDWLISRFSFLSDDMILGFQDGLSCTLLCFAILFIVVSIKKKRHEENPQTV